MGDIEFPNPNYWDTPGSESEDERALYPLPRSLPFAFQTNKAYMLNTQSYFLTLIPLPYAIMFSQVYLLLSPEYMPVIFYLYTSLSSLFSINLNSILPIKLLLWYWLGRVGFLVPCLSYFKKMSSCQVLATCPHDERT